MTRPRRVPFLKPRFFVRLFSNHTNRSPLRNSWFFKDVISGLKIIDSQERAEAFLGAMISQNKLPVASIERILASPHGLTNLQTAFNIDTSPEYIDSTLQPVLSWLQHPGLQYARNGSYLRRTVNALVHPPGFWNNFVYNHKYSLINEQSTQCFAWLLLQLLTLMPETHPAHLRDARDPLVLNALTESPNKDINALGQRIENVANSFGSGVVQSYFRGFQPRHDNDFNDFMKISVLPTPEEILSDEQPYLFRADQIDQEVDHNKKRHMYVSNLFRLYRQDFAEEIKDPIQVALGKKSSFRKTEKLSGLQWVGVSPHGGSKKSSRHPWTLELHCLDGLPELKGLNAQKREKYVREHPEFIPDQSLGCLMSNGELLAIVKFWRNERLLAESTVCVQIPDQRQAERVMLRMLQTSVLELHVLDTAGYAHEPVLSRLKGLNEVPFEKEFLFWDAQDQVADSVLMANRGIRDIVAGLEYDPGQDLQKLMGLGKSIMLDSSQARCLVSSLRQRVSLVQGPPGTGKSFIGALATKALYDHTNETILVVCYTNQALDQFIQDIKKIGIEDSKIVRLGSRERTDPANQDLLLSELRNQGSHHRSRDGISIAMEATEQASRKALELDGLFSGLQKCSPLDIVLPNLMNARSNKSQSGRQQFFEAFKPHKKASGTTRVAGNSEPANPLYLIQRWIMGKDPGVYSENQKMYPDVWDMPLPEREMLLDQWRMESLKNNLPKFFETAKRHDELLDQTNDALGQLDEGIIQGKRIIACTTSAAAKYTQIQSAAPGIVIVEEAGEILESHIITALGYNTKQLIMIGDHKQLRPKVSHKLSVEQGSGYDLNRSLFERLILKGYPHHVLAQQHRMRPEISHLVRQLTYPELIDAPKTQDRPNLLGFSDNVIFVNHEHLEDQAKDESDAVNLNTSKRNTFEAKMVLSCVKYLVQQNYDVSEFVVLTPYLSQLKRLQKVIGKELDTMLDERDLKDLEKAGMDAQENISTKRPDEDAKPVSKPSIRISTIDNYQGQESDIVVASLTRSNADGELGFLSQPERLNVLLSRARNAHIMIGNVSTFKNARQGKDFWTRFFQLLEEGNHVYEGFPVKCEKHPEKTALLRTPEDFGAQCPDGGCTEPCTSKLACGVHECPLSCHHQDDHSAIKCRVVLQEKCARGLHVQTFQCHERVDVISKPCNMCQLEDQAKKRERKGTSSPEKQQKKKRTKAGTTSAESEIDDNEPTPEHLEKEPEGADKSSSK